MKVLQINTVYGEGSTGKIVKALHDICVSRNIECISAHRCVYRGRKPFEDTVEISSRIDSRIHGVLSRFTMFKGCFSKIKTACFLNKVDKFSPDLIHLHNLHGSYVNLPLLFRYIKKNNIPVVWTLHDCWSFTAICSHFSIAQCEKWKTGCGNCPQRKILSSCPIDNTGIVWKQKKKWFTGVKDMTLVAPSQWLADLVKQSFLKDYPIKVINNGIDLNVFKPTESDFRKRYGLTDKYVLLGAAFGWGKRKGLDVFTELSKRLNDKYRIVLVGTDDETGRLLPDNIISIHRTNNQKELAEIYTAADLFVNPTREEVLGLVNIEALACGTPVITFDTGGSPECIDNSCGCVVPCDDVTEMEKAIIFNCEKQRFSQKACLKQARKFDKNKKFNEYLELYLRGRQK